MSITSLSPHYIFCQWVRIYMHSVKYKADCRKQALFICQAKALWFVLLFMIFSRESPQKSGLLSIRVLPRYSWHPTEESCQEKLKSLDLKMFSETLSLDLKILEIFLSTGQFVAFSCSANVSVMVLDQLVDEADLSSFRTKVSIKLLSTALSTYWMALHNVIIL